MPCIPRRVERPDTDGYLLVRATRGNRRVVGLAHRLVWRALHGPIPPGLTVNHENGRKDDNRPGNLKLATYGEQMLHAIHVLGLHGQGGEKNNHAKLTEKGVAEMRKRRAEGETMRSIAGSFGVHESTVSKIVNGHRWVTS